jgi:hypothetical protein
MSDVFHGLPRRLKIGQFTFRVKVLEKVQVEEDQCFGSADLENQVISLVSKLRLEQAVNTVQHEITHCINYVYGVDDDSTEEQVTTQHTNGQIAFWLDNPKAFAWLARSLRAIRAAAKKDEE